jgi:uncharacterized membrane protein
MEKDNNQMITLNFEKISIKKIAAIVTALIIICNVITVAVIIYAPRSPGHHEMYLLGTQSQAVNGPQILVINQNNTFSKQIVVVNNNPKPCDYQVQVKIVRDTFSFPINAPAYKTYEFSLDPKQSWSDQVPISINEKGNHSIVFELYAEKDGDYKFTKNYLVIHVEVVTSTGEVAVISLLFCWCLM